MVAKLHSWRRPAAILAVTAVGAAAVFLGRPAIAAAGGVEGETEFVLNTFAFLIWGALVMWMCAGFTMLESGSVRTKNASMICLKNIGLYSIAGLAYFVIGYNLMYVDVVGDFILWFGWFGFNGGSQLALASAFDAVSMSNVLVNTNLAAAAGVMSALALSRFVLRRIDLFAGLNGAIAGLVSITAGPYITEHWWAIIIGAIGGVICTLGIKLLEKLKLDDVVGAVPAHLFAGIWGTLAVCIAAGGDFGAQITGVAAVGGFVFVVSWLLWQVLARTVSVRVSPEVEHLGQDAGELGIEAYPEFMLMPEEFPDMAVATAIAGASAAPEEPGDED